jgi:hypothetical protein
MQSVGGTSLLSRSVTVTVVSKTYRRTRDKRALSIAGQGEGRLGPARDPADLSDGADGGISI